MAATAAAIFIMLRSTKREWGWGTQRRVDQTVAESVSVASIVQASTEPDFATRGRNGKLLFLRCLWDKQPVGPPLIKFSDSASYSVKCKWRCPKQAKALREESTTPPQVAVDDFRHTNHRMIDRFNHVGMGRVSKCLG